MATDEATPGREPVQIVQIVQPKCINVFGTVPCTATGTADTKCFNTRGTCRSLSDFRARPHGHLQATLDLSAGDTVSSSELTLTADLFLAADVAFDLIPSGVIYEQGSSTTGIYLGVTGSNLVFRAGDGASGAPANAAKVSVATSTLVGSRCTLLAAIDVSANSVTLWKFCSVARTATLLATNTAVGSFSAWADADGGAVGQQGGSGIVAGETAAAFTGTIHSVKLYDGTPAPTIVAGDYKLDLYFSTGTVAAQTIPGAPYIIPSLKSVSTSPTRINLAGTNPDASGLGNRALCSIEFMDHPHTDRLVDPYLAGRTYNPMTQGSFWTKWLARNKYRQNIRVVVYEGYSGQALSAMRQRAYYWEGVNGPETGGRVSVSCKDVLARIEERKATAPAASPGKLYEAITDAQTSFEIADAVLTDYPASGTLRIGEELMTYSARVESTNGLTFTITLRGTDGTTAAAHAVDDSVQNCLRYSSIGLTMLLRDMCAIYGGIEDGLLDLANWETEVADSLAGYALSTVISAPTGVSTLLEEIQEQTLCYLWWDEYAQKVKLNAVRPLVSEVDTITEETHILADSFNITDEPRRRTSQVWVYHLPKSWTKDLGKETSWNNLYVAADLASESFDGHGTSSIRKIMSRWLTANAQVVTTASKLLVRYVDTPRTCRFQIDAKDRENFTVGRTFRIQHHLDVDQFGQRRLSYWTIISADEVAPGETVSIVAEDTTAFGRVYLVQAAAATDYNGSNLDFNNAFIGGADGLLNDGEPCARIT